MSAVSAGGAPPRTADVVIVGGGVHGASLAYHLARKQAGRIVLVEKKFVASGPTGRSTALVRRFYAMDFFTRTASAAAEILSDVILHGKSTGFDLTPFRASRFREGDLLPRAGWVVPPHPKHRLGAP